MNWSLIRDLLLASILCCALPMRVAGQGLLDHYGSHEWSESFAHQFVGLVMLLPAVLLLLALGWILDNLFIEEVDKRSIRGLVIVRRAAQAKQMSRFISEAHLVACLQ